MKRNGGGWNQTVCDDEGRRRFHGAFQGGFSAGYFNTVGSKEGWAPKSFNSSKTTRARVHQRLEDFMDEDDDPLLGKQLETSRKFDTLQEKEKTKLNSIKFHETIKPLQFSFPSDWILPTRPSIGTQLLCKTGWKPGMGIGPKFKKRIDTHQNVTYVYMDPKPHLTASDFPPVKSNLYGLGFDPFVNAPEFERFRIEQEKKSKAQGQRQILSFATSLQAPKSILQSTEASSTNYGLGALEDDDDVDIYGPSLILRDVDTEIGRKRKKTPKMITGPKDMVGNIDANVPGFYRGRDEQKTTIPGGLLVPKDFSGFHAFPEIEAKSAVSQLYEKYHFTKINAKTLRKAPETTQTDGKSVFELLSTDQIARIRETAQTAHKEEIKTQRTLLDQEVVASDFFANRFVSAGHSQHSQSREEKTKQSEYQHKTEKVQERSKVCRSEEFWIPTSLLCKRWGVKCSRATSEQNPSSNRKFSVDSILQATTLNNMTPLRPRTPVSEKDEPDLPDLNRPSESLLKVIFEPSDESVKEEDSSEEDLELHEDSTGSLPVDQLELSSTNNDPKTTSPAILKDLDDKTREKMLRKLERSLETSRKHKSKKHKMDRKSRKRSREHSDRKRKKHRKKD